MRNLIYGEECYQIVGLCMEVHKILGPGLLEVVYKDAMEYEFQQNGVPYEREKSFIIPYKTTVLPRKYISDFLACGEIVLEIKADTMPVESHLKQTMNYMALAKSPLGIIINFGEESLKYKRVIRSGNINPKY
jgi:GxxExxY protein